MSLVQTFVYLQLLDLLTTLLGFRLGAGEASPFIRLMMHWGPGVGVILSKVLALGLGGWCVHRQKFQLIRVATYWYCLLVIWNLMILLQVPGF